jgi:DNA invertase Pin-like site-specific DNA recombinase
VSDKIRATHLQRLAAVYVRQSTMRQVIEHAESNRRQHDLMSQRALELGWPESSIEIIDKDLGQSSVDPARRRADFEHLNEEVVQGRIGAVFAIEASRLARSSPEWQRLLDLCGVADVVLVDEQTVYDPADPSDRMTLGIKGVMSEAELSWLRQRMHGARVSKARRGVYHLSDATGYQWDRATSRWIFDPDEEVQRAMRLVFARFRTERSAYGVMRYFEQHGLRLPARSADGTTVRWSPPQRDRILTILHNPTYAGAYVYGRTRRQLELIDGQTVRRTHRVPVEQCPVVIQNHHPAYISWEEFMDNQRILADNRTVAQAPEHHGAAHRGEALLQGLVLCGRCGHRMQVHYQRHPQRGLYRCRSARRLCWSVAAPAIDQSVVALFLEALRPDAIALGLAMVEEVERQQAELDQQWILRLDRARYEARLAERRYKAVDPDHRTVARTLEGDWDVKLSEVQQLEREHSEVQARDKLVLTPTDRARITELSRDVPQLWNAETTTMAQRKTMLRTLVREVCLAPAEGTEHSTRVRVLWQTGAVSELVVAQQPGQHVCQATAEKIRKLVADGTPVAQIIAALNDAHLTTARGRRWTAPAVYAYCRYHRVPWPHQGQTSTAQPEYRSDGTYSLRGVARRLRVNVSSVRHWLERGWITSVEGGGRGHARRFRLDQATLAHLRRVRAAHARPLRDRSRPSKRAHRRRPPRRRFSNHIA